MDKAIWPHFGNTLASMRSPFDNDDLYIDANGCPTELIELDGQVVLVHYDDLPESDITVVDGCRCTTALRTVIDIAAELEADELDRVVRDCLERDLFKAAQARDRISEPDMLARPGADLLRDALRRVAPTA